MSHITLRRHGISIQIVKTKNGPMNPKNLWGGNYCSMLPDWAAGFNITDLT